MSVQEERYTELKKKHSDWLNDNVRHIAWSTDSWEREKLETLYESRCVKCMREMGEHSWDSKEKQFICPEEPKEEGLGALFG